MMMTLCIYTHLEDHHTRRMQLRPVLHVKVQLSRKVKQLSVPVHVICIM